jgi:hypothetical protein
MKGRDVEVFGPLDEEEGDVCFSTGRPTDYAAPLPLSWYVHCV